MKKAIWFISVMTMIALQYPIELRADPIPSPYRSCVSPSNGGRNFSTGQSGFNFFNGCGERVYINACVKDSWGDYKLYRSGRSIMPGGRFSIYTAPNADAASLQWLAGPSDPGVPTLCVKAK